MQTCHVAPLPVCAPPSIDHVTVDFIDDAYEMLGRGAVDAVVYDFPVLRYQTQQYPEDNFEVVGTPFNRENYGIAFESGSPLREVTNRTLLRLRESGLYEGIYSEWFGASESN